MPLPLDEVLASLGGEQMEEKMDRDTIAGVGGGGVGDIGAAGAGGGAVPEIIYRTQRSMLVLIDGEPILERNKRWGLDAVVNSPFVIVRGSDGKFYLFGDGHWYVAPAATGPYVYTNDKVKRNLKKIARELKTAAEEEGDWAADELEDQPAYEIIVRTVPAELIQCSGDPYMAPLAGTSLRYVFNSENDILVDTGTQQYYVLLAGRWYRSAVLNENARWQYVAAGQLPADFKKIPAASPEAGVLASVAGTEEAREAALDAQVPEMVKVDRLTAASKIQYDGAPKFSPIEGTHLQYAVNTCATVLLSNGMYYAMDNGVWFVGGSPLGPWFVSTRRPEEMDLVPRSCPVYPAKFISVYDGTPEYVYEVICRATWMPWRPGVPSGRMRRMAPTSGARVGMAWLTGAGVSIWTLFLAGGMVWQALPGLGQPENGAGVNGTDKFHGGWRGERRQRIDGRWVAVNGQGVNVMRGVTSVRDVTAMRDVSGSSVTRGVTRLGQSGSQGQAGRPATPGFGRSVSYNGRSVGGSGAAAFGWWWR